MKKEVSVAVQNPRCPGVSPSRTFGLPALHPCPAHISPPPAQEQTSCRPRRFQRTPCSLEHPRYRQILGTQICTRRPSTSSPPQSWLTRAGRADRIFRFLLVPPTGREGSLPAANCPNHEDASLYRSPPSRFPPLRSLTGHLAASWAGARGSG